MSITRESLLKYVTTGVALAEEIKKCVQKDGTISNKAILALNEFIIAYNAIADLADELKNADETRPKGTKTH